MHNKNKNQNKGSLTVVNYADVCRYMEQAKADAGDDRCCHTARVAGADVLETVLGDEHEQTGGKRDGRVGADARFLGPVLPLKADTGACRQRHEKADDPFILKH